LIITGLGASLQMAEPFERELATHGRQTISFDAPGVGESTGYRWPDGCPGSSRPSNKCSTPWVLTRSTSSVSRSAGSSPNNSPTKPHNVFAG
ncbi:MAG: hypothetical protein WCH93_12045, partial [Actinomycetota bacterium]